MLIKCPLCKKKSRWEGNPWRPFCSERCKMADLGKWAAEEYIIESKPEEDEDEKEDLNDKDYSSRHDG
jgi:uncharacterized protein